MSIICSWRVSEAYLCPLDELNVGSSSCSFRLVSFVFKKVPALRLALGFYVHLVVLALYTAVATTVSEEAMGSSDSDSAEAMSTPSPTIDSDNAASLGNSEIVLTFYVVVSTPFIRCHPRRCRCCIGGIGRGGGAGVFQFGCVSARSGQKTQRLNNKR